MSNLITLKASSCRDCPRGASGYRCIASPQPPPGKDSILWVYTQPEPCDIGSNHPGSSGSTYSVMRTALAQIYRDKPARQGMPIRITYAAQCVPEILDDKPNAKVLTTCQPLVKQVVGSTGMKLIVAFGSTALKQLGIKDKWSDMRGRVLEPDFTGLPAPLLVTFSEKAITAAPGVFTTFVQDLRNGYTRVERGRATGVSLEDLTAKYVLPDTMDEALAVCDTILASPTARQGLSVDTETTSLRPEKEGARLIAFTFSWDVGVATTIIYDHPHASPEYLERLSELREKLALILGDRALPKILHGYKFDYKWTVLKAQFVLANVVWCTLGGEHLLDEDKKGNYGLKALTTVFMPDYCGYEDKLFDILEATDEDLIANVDAKITSLGDEYDTYAEALEDFKTEYATYVLERALWEEANEQYVAELDVYTKSVEAYKFELETWEALPKKPKKPVKPPAPRKATGTDEEFAGYTALLQAYDAALAAWQAWEAPPKPAKDFTKPAKPPRLASVPKEPKDPRSKKEKQYATDAGFENVALKDLQIYGAVDADVTRRLSSIQLQRLANEKSNCRRLMATHVLPASRVLGDIEFHGVTIDQAHIPVLEAGLTQALEQAKAELTQMAGPDVNLNSGPALARLLYEDGWTHPDGTHMPPVPCLLLTKKQARSTSAAALAPYLKYDEVYTAGVEKPRRVPQRETLLLDRLFIYKKAVKARDTFLSNIRILSKRDGRIHTTYHIPGTGTGRLSCIAGESLVKTRRGFIAIRTVEDTDWVWTHKNRWRQVRRIIFKGVEEMQRVTMPSGAIFTATKDHHVWHLDSWVAVSDLPLSIQREPVEAQGVWDLEVDEDNSYMTEGGVFHHNSADMNLQNIPKVLAGYNLKRLFIPDDPDEQVFVNVDWKGAEVRVFTAYAPDPALIKALNDGLDMHSFFAAQVFKRPYADYVNRDAPHFDADYSKLLNKERTQIKRVVFGILYGAAAKKISEQIGVSHDEGQKLIDLLFEMFPAIRDYIEEIKYLVARDGYVDTLFGRRRRFPLQATSRHRGRAERQAQNFKIQSTSSDIVIAQLIEMHELIHSERTWPEWGIHRPLHTYNVRILLTVHDSIGLQWPKALLEGLGPWVRWVCEQRVKEKFPWLPVPFACDIEVGPSYGEVEPLSKYLTNNPTQAASLHVEDDDEIEIFNTLRNDAFDGKD